MASLPFDPSLINTGLLITIAGGIWRALMKLNRVDQSVTGIEGQGGLLRDVKEILNAKNELEKSVVALTAAVDELQKFRLTIESIVAMRRNTR